jgi:drug/metabolite transporter (DMT)-like permease
LGIGLGLGAAVSWGLADYFAALASRRVGTLPVVLGFHLVACAFLGVLVAATGDLGRASWDDLPFFLLVGALGFGSYLTFYRALAIGPISVVSPIVSGYAAVTVLLAVIVRGERLSAGESVAIALVVGGVVLTTLDPSRLPGGARAGGLGIALAIATTLLIGGFVFGVADRTDRLGWLVPIFLARLVSTGLVFAATTARGELRPRGWGPSILATLVFLGLIDTAGYISFNVGVRHAATSIVATASAPYALIPIALGVLLLHERPTRTQWGGVIVVLAGLVLLGLFS